MTAIEWTPRHEQAAQDVAREWHDRLPLGRYGILADRSGSGVMVTTEEVLDLVRRAYRAGATDPAPAGRHETALRNVRDKLRACTAVYIGDDDATAAARIIVRDYRRGLSRFQNVKTFRDAICDELGPQHPARAIRALVDAVEVLDAHEVAS